MGDSVAEDEVVCEIETDKVAKHPRIRRTVCFCVSELLSFALQTSVQVPSPAAGVIEELLVPDGGKVEGGTPLFKVRQGGHFQEALKSNP